MKKTFLIFLISIVSLSVIHAQDSTSSKKISSGKGEKVIINIYNDFWQGADTSLTVKSFNRGVAFYLMYNVPFGKSKFSFNIGFGLGSHNLFSDASPAKEMSYDSVSSTNVYTGNTIFNRIPKTINGNKIEYIVNKINLSYFDVPVEFKYSAENKKGKDIRFAVGFKAGYLINNHTKYSGDDYLSGTTDKVKYKNYKIPNIETLRYGVTARFNYGMFGVFGYYSLTNIFKKDKGLEMYPVSAGIAISLL
ncbi:MAG TPA: porin family protein [Bacteroidales bacterium]|nr:porin family protein [Bacteroidales bacterium]HPS17441.1 porin family protein [Bacteroidales bacterium]